MNTRALAAAMLYAYCGATAAAPIVYSGRLSGAAESPPNASAGSGTTLVAYDPAAHTLDVQVTFSGLSGTTTASHIHCCTTNAGTGTASVATQVPTFSGFPLGVTSGTYSMSFDLTMSSAWNPSFVTTNGGTVASAETAFAAGLDTGKAYLNIHSSTVPGGEIRSFLIDSIFANGFEP
jgi:hypothetical protein